MEPVEFEFRQFHSPTLVVMSIAFECCVLLFAASSASILFPRSSGACKTNALDHAPLFFAAPEP